VVLITSWFITFNLHFDKYKVINMKKLFLLIVLTSSLSSSFAQQHLWSTKKLDDSTINIVSMDSAISNVLGFYDLYDYYYDMSGYSKENFINLFENPETFK
jgi:hypothetical protein